MLRFRAPQARIGRAVTRPVIQTPPKSLYSSKHLSSASNFRKVTKYTLVAGALGASGLWWLVTTSIREDDEVAVPRLDNHPTENLNLGKGPCKEDVTRILNQNAYHFHVKNVAGVDRYDGSQLACFDPCEDRFIHGQFSSPWGDGSQWMAWAIFDGYLGWQTADLLEKRLLPFVQQILSRVKPALETESMHQVVQRTLMEAFIRMDESIMHTVRDLPESEEPLQDKMKKIAPAYAGSGALLSLFDPVSGLLHVAYTGNSRAILAQKTEDGKWNMIPMTLDHSGYNKNEVERITKEHPGEEDMVHNGQLVGLPVTRAFGHARWKFPLALQHDLRRRFGAPSPVKQNILTPPYLTAAPDVVSFSIDPKKPSFLIMASYGLWEFITCQQAVDLVGKWIESQGGKAADGPEPMYKPFDFSHCDDGVKWEFDEKRATVQDENAAVHLVRNALGGNHHEMVAGKLAMTAPYSRAVRDDMTVQVVFFNQPGLDNKGKQNDNVMKTSTTFIRRCMNIIRFA
ncbi:putative pyruvate dehydrogenase [Annulohypoxylon maeteangense]|uniref:putative pyruvate dehydrogenase n=1 Tax=Annulohypoxylon maeteangense TaxID=1927788 RepID=UPI0020084612|nr:putative pyruvate dehydrogenase [Annulohypoxylon maeteangense]KAI0886532.1 putative pyruvate dehydrogenase [Annulohypoxylon maeteangense]